ncbi:AAA domain-containing protein [Vibrio sp. CAIM 722]|uniref:AAA domain-containing protein n=1 Tax=Vibrio eleionomae TaxID=2653505 RepID=A0A7X4LKC2_9VIBR|nr:sigma-54 dependent transcriptional regulator [Vibrio eleionomae]MZI93222.1 AAA domain-containing protein [Vibrio eleionomae]
MTANTDLKHLPLYQAFSVLVIQYEGQDQHDLLHALENWFATIHSVSSYSDAVNSAEKHHYDLVIVDVDVVFEEEVIWEQLAHWHEEKSDVLLLVQLAEFDRVVSAFKLGLCDFIINPVNSDQLTHMIKRCMERRLKDRRLGAHHFNFTRHSSSQIIGQSEITKLLRQHIEHIGPSKASVLIEGQPGTGKELIARELHEKSRRIGPFVPFSCASISMETLSSQLYGELIVARDGVRKLKEGVFKLANGGTLYLDEIANFPLSAQDTLLNVLEERAIRPIGSKYEFKVDVRVVAGTQVNLHQLVQQGRFRSELLYRLNVVRVEVQPLKNRKSDLRELVPFLAGRLCTDLCLPLPKWNDQDIKIIREYDWPGNVRELRNLIENCILLGKTPREYWRDREKYSSGPPVTVTVSHGSQIPYYAEPKESVPVQSTGYPDDWPLKQVERHHIEQVVKVHEGNKSAASRALGVARKTLERKFKEWDCDNE